MSKIEALRMQVRALEGYHLDTCQGDQTLPFEDGRLNAPLPHGGLKLGALHEFRSDGLEAELAPAVTAFAATVAARILRSREGSRAMGFEPRRLLCARPRTLRPRSCPHHLGRLPEGQRGSGRHGGGFAFARACRRFRRGGNAEPENGAKAGRGGAAVGRDSTSHAAHTLQVFQGRLRPERRCGHPLARVRRAGATPHPALSPWERECAELATPSLLPGGEGQDVGKLRTRPRSALLAARPRILPQRQTGIVDCGGVGWLRRRRH